MDGAEPRDAGMTWLSSPGCRRGANRILLASALSSMHIICPNRVSQHDWIIAVNIACGSIKIKRSNKNTEIEPRSEFYNNHIIVMT